MKLIRNCISFLLLLIVMGGEEVVYSADKLSKNESDNLINTFSFYETPDQFQGCGCSFYLGTSEDMLVFISQLGEKEKTLMKIDGTFVFLKLKDPRSLPIGTGGATKIGDKLKYAYTADRINVDIELTATSVCPPGDEKCEGQSYRVVITVVKGKKKQTLRVSGNCGC